ncbi:signal transduction histidine kinase [Murinocardiopsis flavida]|uniref:histidine kinase n=1 Tax=Murinocardiopsis flavida TaxID=645275 RepID=A0A2P8DV35_9ACTN|nr:sensor histidine kinase [Murinocardiopsis flavida]PSL01061.1 signal transduction histidine kinase [Murinocardiopsis flavida]
MRDFLRRLEQDDLTVVLLLTGIVLASSFFADPGARAVVPWGLVLILIACGSLYWRRRFPVTVLAVASSTAMLYYVNAFPDGLVILPAMLALVSVVVRGMRWQAWAFGLGFYSAFHGIEVFFLDQPFAAHALGNLSWVLLFLISGEVVRKQNEATDARKEQAAEAQRVHEEALRRSASDERLRLAREVHDVVAHNISLINVQAGTALYLIDAEPGRAREALSTIKSTSRDTLKELRATLGVLRAVDEEAPRAPTPDLADLPELLERSRTSGIAIGFDTEGDTSVLPANVRAAAYRIVQESVTNAVRHSRAGRIDVRVAFDGDDLTVGVSDDGRGAPQGFAAGNGIRGMRERAAALGGALDAGPGDGGGFRVHARLPRSVPYAAGGRDAAAADGSEQRRNLG